MNASDQGNIVLLCGGIGGAKLALGFSRVMAPERLTIIVNVGDDFRHFGLNICPDIDTVVYTLAGLVNTETGWGRANETWRFMESVRALGHEAWFNLGDTDLAMHAVRTARLSAGESLTEVTKDLARRAGVAARILPATDQPTPTIVETAAGPMDFQRWFVENRAEPAITKLRYEGVENARPTNNVADALTDRNLQAVVFCPSNPYLSLDPMLAVPGMRDLVRASGAPVVAVTPIVQGQSIKGPLAKIMRDLRLPVTPWTVVRHYRDLLDVFVADRADPEVEVEAVKGVKIVHSETIMISLADRENLARQILREAEHVRRGR
jgi:LPPG:FO 2-phospho-L-lactate transferase